MNLFPFIIICFYQGPFAGYFPNIHITNAVVYENQNKRILPSLTNEIPNCSNPNLEAKLITSKQNLMLSINSKLLCKIYWILGYFIFCYYCRFPWVVLIPTRQSKYRKKLNNIYFKSVHYKLGLRNMWYLGLSLGLPTEWRLFLSTHLSCTE